MFKAIIFRRNTKSVVMILITALLISFAILTFSFFSNARHDVVYGQGLPGVFGGRIGGILSCDPICLTVGVGIFVGPPGVGTSNPLSPGWIHVTPGTTIYEYGQIRPGVWVLGNYRPPSPCAHYNGWHCVPVPVVGDAVIMGTSR